MNNTVVKPEVGMGATLQYPSDCYPFTIIEVNATGKTIKVQRDQYKRTDKNGQSESQSYEYTPDTNASVQTYTLRKNGRYHLKGESTNGAVLNIGKRRAYSSPSL